ncbi:MAG: GDSL-type esterase/lipase family protein [Vicinamibacterales bacterium]
MMQARFVLAAVLGLSLTLIAGSAAVLRHARRSQQRFVKTACRLLRLRTPRRLHPTYVLRVVFLGDSLTAGLGLAQDEACPTLIQHKIDAEGLRYQVVNAGVSGDTSAGGLSRLDWALDGDVTVMVVALGGDRRPSRAAR